MDMEQQLIPYSAVSILGAGPVLVLAPHPDDEVLGCGGALRRHVLAGDAVRVVVVTDGAAAADDGERERTAQLRREESCAAARLLGYPQPLFWQLPDRGLRYGEPLIRRLLEAIREHTPALLYAPSLLERHPDHRVLAMAVLEALRRLEPESAPTLAMYEVAVPLNPNRLLDISDLMEEKRRAIACFASQLALQEYGRQVTALNEFRSYTLPKAVRAAEAYLLVESGHIAASLADLYLPEHLRQQRLGLELDSADLPLVSILVRSNGRRELRQTLDTIALQSYPRIEVCLICVHGEEVPVVGDLCGRYPLRQIDRGEPLPRSRAANTGLKEARGRYLMFLDDDDLLDPDHVSGLVELLEQGGHRIAYSGVRCIYEGGAEGQPDFNEAFDPVLLLAGNYIPIHAVLFRRDFVDQGCRFDEDLDVYEDWDFWLQLSQLAWFHHLERISASYRISRRSGFGVNAPPRQAEESALKVYRKWSPRWSDEQFTTLMVYARQRAETWHLPQVVAQLQEVIAARDEERAALNHRIAQGGKELSELREQLQEWKRDTQPQLKRIEELERALDEAIAERDRRGEVLQRVQSNPVFGLYRQAVRPVKFILRGLRAVARMLRGQAGGWKRLRFFAGVWHAGGMEAVREERLRERLRADPGHPRDYSTWTALYDGTSRLELRQISRWVKELHSTPLISVLMPTYNSDEASLRGAIDSVLAQIYPNWELCIADDASTDPWVRPLLREYARRDPRIKVVERPLNGHIAAASNSALEIAGGRFVAFLDHDDLLAPNALFWVAKHLDLHPDAELIYTDEDKIDGQGRRFDPYFKPSWNADLFRSHNMICHLAVYRRTLLESIGGFRSGFDGAQDYDLALRAIEQVRKDRIHHISRVLYHWRALPSSTAADLEAKPYAQEAAKRALQEHLERQGWRGEVLDSDEAPGMYRIRYQLPEVPPHVTLIVLTRDRAELLQQCVDSILERTLYPAFEILIVDNGSEQPEALDYLRRIALREEVSVLRDDRPFNYSALNNRAVEQAKGPLIALLNNDLEVINGDWLNEMVSHVLRPGVGAVGARLWYPDDRLQHGGVVLGIGGIAGHSHKGLPKGDPGYFGRAVLIQNYSAVTGACLLTHRDAFDRVGGLDEKHLTVAFNDVDFCLRLRRLGYSIVWTPYAQLYHHESASRGYEDTPEKLRRLTGEVEVMQQRWGELLKNDPSYNPNLTHQAEDFSLAWPPNR